MFRENWLLFWNLTKGISTFKLVSSTIEGRERASEKLMCCACALTYRPAWRFYANKLFLRLFQKTSNSQPISSLTRMKTFSFYLFCFQMNTIIIALIILFVPFFIRHIWASTHVSSLCKLLRNYHFFIVINRPRKKKTRTSLNRSSTIQKKNALSENSSHTIKNYKLPCFCWATKNAQKNVSLQVGFFFMQHWMIYHFQWMKVNSKRANQQDSAIESKRKQPKRRREKDMKKKNGDPKIELPIIATFFSSPIISRISFFFLVSSDLCAGEEIFQARKTMKKKKKTPIENRN